MLASEVINRGERNEKKQKGLGRGLGAFFGEEVVDEVSGKSSDGAEAQKELFVKVTEIEPNPDQPRKYFDEEQLNELAESIRQYGVLQPLLRPEEERPL